jgi:eukaryotic-like serine/threonine-protein kinase
MPERFVPPSLPAADLKAAPGAEPVTAAAALDAAAPATAPAAASRAVRWFGRMQLLRLLGRSERTMAWRVADSATGQEQLLVLPRQAPADAAGLDLWHTELRRAARVNHPQLAQPLATGTHEGWPWATYDLQDCDPLSDTLVGKALPGLDAAALTLQLLPALAFAHEAGVAHHDLQSYLVLVPDKGPVRLVGAAVACELAARLAPGSHTLATPESSLLHWQRACAERDVIAAGLLLHQMLAGSPALDEPDTGRAIARLTGGVLGGALGRAPTSGRSGGGEIVRLPWSGTQPISEALRAICNRATDRQERQRYRSARTLARALQGWVDIESSAGGGPLALLGDRLRSNGVLPAAPGATARAARLDTMLAERTNELADVVLEDVALSFEMLRLVNSAQVRGTQLGGSGAGPVLTVRRAIAMLGIDGVRRAANSLREWPGPLGDEHASALQRYMAQCQRAAHAARVLRPADYDAEVVSLLTLLQNLGRLVAYYHFPDEAQQIDGLMQPQAAQEPGQPDEPGMSEEAAAYAVLGADLQAVGAAVARQWGMDDKVLSIMRRVSTSIKVRGPDDDDEMLRIVASCANEAVEAQLEQNTRSTVSSRAAAQGVAPLQRVTSRYAKTLNLRLRDLQLAVGEAPSALSKATLQAQES